MQFTSIDPCIRHLDLAAEQLDLDLAAERLAKLKIERDQAEAAFIAQQNHLISLLDEIGVKSTSTSRYKITKRFSERVVVNESGLKKALGAVKFNKLTDRKLNRAKLNAAVAAGEVDPVLVAQNSNIKETSAWVSVNENHGEEE